MNKLLLLNAFEGQLEKLAQDRDETPQKSTDEKERDMVGSAGRTAMAMSDSIKREKKRIKRGRIYNQFKPKMFRDEKLGTGGVILRGLESAENVMSHADKISGKSRYDAGERAGRLTARATQMAR